MEKYPILEIKKVTKSYAGVVALNQVDFTLYPGEVHIIAGKNGAGKSTLVKSILGIITPEEGEIIYKGQERGFLTPGEAIHAGIAAVHQELTMVPYLNAVENIFLGKELVYKGTNTLNQNEMKKEAKEILKKLHSEDIPLNQPVKSLGIAKQQMLEIAKVLVSHPKVILFDEPTAALTKQETAFLFEQIRELKNQGIGIIYISHRMDEFSQIGDRVTVLRDGKNVLTCDMNEISMDELVGKMMGETSSEKGGNQPSVKKDREKKEAVPLLKAEHLSDKKGRVKDASLEIYAGEIVGICGIVGSGRTELANLLSGTEKMASGSIYRDGKKIEKISPGKMIHSGVGFLPEDRKRMGLALDAPIFQNITAASLHEHFPKRILSVKKEKTIAQEQVQLLGISTPNVEKNCSQLSGGNQQKVVLGKWIAAHPDVLIFDEPTRGIDVGAKNEIYDLMRRLAESGKGILMISSELEEVTALSDRIYTMKEGVITDCLSADECDISYINQRIFSGKVQSADTEDKKKNSIGHYLNKICPAFLFLLPLVLLFGWNADNYYTLQNLSKILIQLSPLLVAACGQTFIVLMQGTDLSVGSIVSMTGVLWMLLLQNGISIFASLAICLIAGGVIGVINGCLAANTTIPIFIITLCMSYIIKSVALLLGNNQTLYCNTSFFRWITEGKIFGCHIAVLIAFACLILSIFLLRHTTFGLSVKAIGGNEEALYYSGRNVKKIKIEAFCYMGILAALSGLLLACRIESGNPNAGNGMEFNAIAAVLLGGTSMRGGRGDVGSTFFGVLLIQVLKSGLTQIGVSSVYQNIFIGLALLSAVAWDVFRKNREESALNL